MSEPCPYGCSAVGTGGDDECTTPPDADGDGARADVDCRDTDAAIHPGAVDICGDGIDQDCSGRDKRCMPAGGAGGASAGRASAGAAGGAIDLAGSMAPAPSGFDGGSQPGRAGSPADTQAQSSDAGIAGGQSRRPIRVAPQRAAGGGCAASTAGSDALASSIALMLAVLLRRRRANPAHGSRAARV